MLAYHAAYYRNSEDDGWYIVKVLDFPGVMSQGKTLQSARRMIRDALRLMAETRIDQGKALPRPRSKVTDNKAVFQEKLSLGLRIQGGLAGSSK